jgi:hypothetical protein
MPSKLEAKVSRHDKQIAAMQKLMLTGMKMLGHDRIQIREIRALVNDNARQIQDNTRQIQDNARQIQALSKETRENARILKDLMRSLGRRDQTNGHGKPPKGVE